MRAKFVYWLKKYAIFSRNDYEPDLVFLKNEKARSFEKDQVIFPAPDLLVEIISHGTAAKNRGIKKQDYAAHGVPEYWIIDPDKTRVEQFLLADNRLEYFPPKIWLPGEKLDCKAIEGLKLPVSAIFDDAANVEAMKALI